MGRGCVEQRRGRTGGYGPALLTVRRAKEVVLMFAVGSASSCTPGYGRDSVNQFLPRV